MKYSLERKDAVLKKMLPPHHRPIAVLAEEEGISTATLYLWRTQARAQGRLLPDGATGPESWRGREKFAAVVETAGLNEAGQLPSGLLERRLQALAPDWLEQVVDRTGFERGQGMLLESGDVDDQRQG